MNSHLPHTPDPTQALDGGSDTPRSVLAPWNDCQEPANTRVPDWRATPAIRERRAKRKDDDRRAEPATPEAEWWSDLEYVWASKVRPDVERWEARARELRRQALQLAAYRDGADVDVAAAGVRVASTTRASLRLVGRRVQAASSRRASAYLGGDGRRVLVEGDHGSASLDGRRIELLKSAEWCEARAVAASMARADVLAACRGRWRRIGCGCGSRDVEVGCDQTTLCPWCRRRNWKRWRRRIVRAMGAHLRVSRDRWRRYRSRGRGGGAAPGVYLITLTIPHSGDLRRDRAVIGKGWRAISKAASYGGYYVRDADGNELRYSARKWWESYVLVYEVTPGTDGLGHLHAHVAVVSSWVPYHELRALWRDVTGSVVVDVVAPSTQAARSKARGFASNEAGTAAAYLAKYVTKGVEPRDFTGRKAGELLCAFRGHRKVTTSEGFWRPLVERESVCACCGEPHRLVDAPEGLQTHAPAAVMRAIIERTRWRPPRGAPQVALRWQSSSVV